MITGFSKENHSNTINDDKLWQKDAILNWTLHSISWIAFMMHETFFMDCWTKCQALLDIFDIDHVFPKTDVQPIIPPSQGFLLILGSLRFLLTFPHVGHYV